MKKITTNANVKRITILVIDLLFAIIATINFDLALYGKNKENINISLSTGTEISEINVNNNSYSLNNLKNNDIEYKEDGVNKLVAKTNTNLIIEKSKIDDISITYNLIKSEKDRNVQIGDEIYHFDGNYFFKGVSRRILIKDSFNKFSIIIFVVYVIIMYGCLYFMNRIFNKINLNKEKIYDILLITVFEFIICFSTIYGLMTLYKYLAFIPFIIIIFMVLIKYRFNLNSWKKIYIGIGAITGIMILFLIPPGHVPDEPSHFARSFINANYTFQNKDEIKMPESIEKFFYKFTHNVHSSEQKFSGKMYLSSMFDNSDYNKLYSKKVNYENTRYLSFLPYLPSSIIMSLCRFINLPVTIVFYLSRLINLCICITICYYAIKTTSNYKKIFTLVAMFPIFFQQAMGLNMDYLTNSVTLLLVALILKCKDSDNTLTIKEIIYLSLLGIGIGFCKFGYFPILWLIFLVPNNKFKNKKIVIMFKILFIILPLMLSLIFNLTAVSNPNTKTEFYTINTIINNPLQSAKIFFTTAIYRSDLDLFRGLLDGFGWSTKYHISPVLWTISSMYIIMLFLDNESKKELKILHRIILIFVSLVLFAIIYAVAFTEWTPIGFSMINGIQTRYFVPSLLMLYIAISNNFIKLNVKNKYRFYTILLSIIQLLVVFTLLKSFY